MPTTCVPTKDIVFFEGSAVLRSPQICGALNPLKTRKAVYIVLGIKADGTLPFLFSSFPVGRLFPSIGCLFGMGQAGARFSGRIRSTCLRKIVPETVFRHDLAPAVQAPCFLCIRGRGQAADGTERSIVPTAGGRSIGTNHHIERLLFIHRV